MYYNENSENANTFIVNAGETETSDYGTAIRSNNGVGIIRIPYNPISPPPTHLACVDEACVEVTGEGDNTCEEDSDCEDSPVCTDSDGGNNLTETGTATKPSESGNAAQSPPSQGIERFLTQSGTTIAQSHNGNGFALTDYCGYYTGKINEAICDAETDNPAYVNPPHGQVCPEDTPYCNTTKCSTIPATCTETDDGIDPFNAGEVTIAGSNQSSTLSETCFTKTNDDLEWGALSIETVESILDGTTPLADSFGDCSGERCGVLEFACTEPFTHAQIVIVQCENGCSEGACIPDDFTCDQDGERILGDVDGDGSITTEDAIRAAEISANVFIPTPLEEAAADASGDGTVNALDAALIARHAEGIEDLPQVCIGPADLLEKRLIVHFPFNLSFEDIAPLFGAQNAGIESPVTAPTFSNTGILGSTALEFDGVDDYLIVNLKNQVDADAVFNSGQDSATVTGWVYLDNLNTRQVFFSRLYGHQLYPRITLFADGRVFFQMKVGGVTKATSTSTDAIQPGQWHHIGMTIDTSNNNTVALYVDGVLKNSHPPKRFQGSITGGNKNLWIGKSLFSNWALDGKIDDVRIYDRPLSQLEIQAIYTQGGGTLNLQSAPESTNPSIFSLISGLFGLNTEN